MTYNRLKEVREASGLSRDDLADAMEVTSSFVGQLERGDRKLKDIQIIRIAGILDVHPGELLQEMPAMPEAAADALPESAVQAIRKSYEAGDDITNSSTIQQAIDLLLQELANSPFKNAENLEQADRTALAKIAAKAACAAFEATDLAAARQAVQLMLRQEMREYLRSL